VDQSVVLGQAGLQNEVDALRSTTHMCRYVRVDGGVEESESESESERERERESGYVARGRTEALPRPRLASEMDRQTDLDRLGQTWTDGKGHSETIHITSKLIRSDRITSFRCIALHCIPFLVSFRLVTSQQQHINRITSHQIIPLADQHTHTHTVTHSHSHAHSRTYGEGEKDLNLLCHYRRRRRCCRAGRGQVEPDTVALVD